MKLLILMDNHDDLKALRDLSGINPLTLRHGINQSHFSHFSETSAGIHLEWWNSTSVPDFSKPESVDFTCFYQNGQSVKAVHQAVLDVTNVENQKRKNLVAKMQTLYPRLVFEESELGYGYWARIVNEAPGGGSRSPIDLDDPNLLFKAGIANLIGEYIDLFRNMYPHLEIYPGTLMRINRDLYVDKQNMPWHVSSVRFSNHTVGGTNRFCGTRFHNCDFFFPLQPETFEMLDRLENQVALTFEENSGLFVCSECHEAKPRDKYAHYWFDTVKCTDCATPEWIQRAKSERYN